MALDVFQIITDYLDQWGDMLFAALGLGLSFLINKTLSGTAITFSLLCLFLYFIYSSQIFIFLAVLSVVVGFLLKQSGM